MDSLRLCLFLSVALSALTLASGCKCAGDGNKVNPDGSFEDAGPSRDTGIRRLPDGRVIGEPPTGSSTEGCGGLHEECCGSRSCDRGLRCDESRSECCARPGGAACDRPSDCCPGFICRDRECWAEEGTACLGDDCLAPSVCLGGECREADTGTAGEGEPCAMGVCRSGLACDDDTDRCKECGDRGELCCEGAFPCGSGDSLVCVEEECITPDGRGNPGEPCYPGDVCVRGATCDSEDICREEPPPGSEGSQCGSDGEACCRGGRCGLGSICEPFLTNHCVGLETLKELLDIDCGEEGQICCFSVRYTRADGLRFFTCEGDLVCDWFFCQQDTCEDVTADCDTSDDCCNSGSVDEQTLCLLDPDQKRCCRPAGAACDGELDCCGRMTCEDDPGDSDAPQRCKCVEEGAECAQSQDCCNNGECLEGVCQPRMCVPVTSECMGAGSPDMRCCEGLHCEAIESGGGETQACCAGAGTGCKTGECCGAMECGDQQTCECVDSGGDCQTDGECCGEGGASNGICELAACAIDDGFCERLGSSCLNAADCCASLAACRPSARDTDTDVCCGIQGQAGCSSDDECCGAMKCNSVGICECVDSGEECVVGAAGCCTGLCGADSDSSTGGTCS